MLSATTTAVLSAAFTITYVVPFYILPGTRSSPTVARDDPAVIRHRCQAVGISSFLCSFGVLVFLIGWAGNSLPDALAVMGWWPVGIREALNCLLLTAILFAGPLLVNGVVDGEFREWADGMRFTELAHDWVAWRNVVAGPVTEEIVFRSVMTSIQVASHMPPPRIVFITPLYFGIAHAHLLIESRLCDPAAPWPPLILRTVVQFAYTTVFGWYETFLYLRTGSLLAVCLVHSFCNVNGLPQFWGRVRRWYATYPEGEGGEAKYEELHVAWTYAYYVLLVAGALAFKHWLWALTASEHALVAF